MDSTPQLMLPEKYISDATKMIQGAKQQISLLTMVIDDDELTKDFFEAIGAAAERGVSVKVTADTYTYAELGGHFRINYQNSKKFRSVVAMRRRLIKQGVHFNWLGSLANSLVTSRTHSKWLVIDDTAYTFGGVNLYKAGITNTDFMLKIKDLSLASHLVAEQERIIAADRSGHAYRSHKFGDDKNLVLVDGGFFGDSIIYRRACHLTAKAKKVIYVSQYCPTGKLSKLLKKTNAKLYFNHWNKAESINSMLIRLSSYFSGNQPCYERNKYLHCKFMLFEMEDGERIALTGSHNFAHGGVWLGTREIALETKDKKVISQIEKFVKQQIA